MTEQVVEDFSKKNWADMKGPARALFEHREEWMATAREAQIMPGGTWNTWLLCGGRGAGKTRTGAEAMIWFAGVRPNSRCAIVAATSADARDTCIEGVSGIESIIPKVCIAGWNRSLGEFTLWNGAHIKLFSADEPERLRGPQHALAWCDELGSWRYQDAWDQLQFGLRVGTNPQAIVTTTPRPTELFKRIYKDPLTLVSRESTFANAKHLPEAAIRRFIEKYQGTRLGRQELEAELIEDVAGALWTRGMLDQQRVDEENKPTMKRIIVAVDPATAHPDEGLAETGVIVAGLGVDNRGYVLDDLSGRMLPNEWARRAVSAYDLYDADAIVYEKNQGGEMVRSTLRAARAEARTIPVHASKGKITRAEPVSALYEQGRVSHVGRFNALEDQMCLFTAAGLENSGQLADRVDAMVWAFTELFPLMTKKRRQGDVSIENTSGYNPHLHIVGS